MKLNVFITDMDVGGRQTVCLSLLKNLCDMGVACRLYVSYPAGRNLVNVDKRVEVFVAGGAIRKSVLKVLRFAWKHPDAPCLSLCSEITIVLGLLKRFKLIKNPIFHRQSTQVKPGRSLWNFLTRQSYPSLSGMILQAYLSKEDFLKIYPIKHRVTRILNPCRFADGNDVASMLRKDDVLLYVGRLSQEKGCDRLVRSIIACKGSLKLELWGDGPMDSVIRNWIKEAHAENYITLCGTSSHVQDVYKRSAIVVIPSYEEGLPNVMIEAILCGCRVVVANELVGAIELLTELGLGACVIEGDFESGLPVAIACVAAQPEELWQSARISLSRMTSPKYIASQVRDFVGEAAI